MSLKRANSLIIAFLIAILFAMVSCPEPTDDSLPLKQNQTEENLLCVSSAIQDIIPPVTGEIPVTTINNSQYTGTVVWEETVSGNPVGTTFNATTEYTATITLTAKKGYTFQGVSVNFFSVTGATSVSNSANSGVVTAMFPKTEDATPPDTEQRKITITGLSFDYTNFSVKLFLANSFLDEEALYYGYYYSNDYQDTVTINLNSYDGYSWYGNGQYYLEFTNWYSSYVYRSTEPIIFDDTNPNPVIDLTALIKSTASPVNPITLTAGVWTNSNIATSEPYLQWFKFTATANTQYIHITHISLGGFRLQLYDSNGNALGTPYEGYNNGNEVIPCTVNIGQEYYVRVERINSGYTYRIAFNASSTEPVIQIPSNVIQLTEGLWANGNISEEINEQWFKFTATANTQYIHLSFPSINKYLFIEVYNSSGNIIGIGKQLGSTYTSLSLTSGQEYYIRASQYDSYTGTYQIAFSASVSRPPTPTTLPTDAIALEINTWADGIITPPQYSYNGVQWFKFTATATKQYIHADFGTLNSLNFEVYDSNGLMVYSKFYFFNTTTNTSININPGQLYYIKVSVTENLSGTYKIAFNESSLTPKSSNATQLIAGLWTDGNIAVIGGEQWFKFTATAATQYIHINLGTLNNLYVYLYKPNGDYIKLDSYNSTTYYKTIDVGQEYYIRVNPNASSGTGSGTYKIAFNASTIPPTAIVPLTANTWAFGNITTPSGEQWFKFTAIADAQSIHVGFSKLTDLYVQVYDSNGNTIEGQVNLCGSYTSVARRLKSGQVYYIKVSPKSGSGTYQIAFNSSTIPPNAITTLSFNNWTDGNITSGDNQLFKFTANASTQYIHIGFGTLNNLYIQVYDSNGNTVGSQTNLSTNNINRYTSLSLTSGQEYYIKVTPYGSSYSGTYRIGYNASTATPPVTLPSNATLLTFNTWANGNITVSDREQWFKFTATAATQYIHINLGTLKSSIYFQIYDSNGSTVENETALPANNVKYTSRTLIPENVYYIKVTPTSPTDNGTFQIAFNTITLPPSAFNAPTLAENTWGNGNISSISDEYWFKFTATAVTQYIHVNFSTINSMNVYIYDSNGSMITGLQMSNSNKYISKALTIAQEYYIKITPTSSTVGAFQIGFNKLILPPSAFNAPTLAVNTWSDGYIPSLGREQWFKFTATAATQYIHVNFGTVSSMDIQIYNTNGNTVGSESSLSIDTTRYISQALTIAQDYYIKVSSSANSTYQIAFNTLSIPPAIQLTENTWADCYFITSKSEQWFKFTATAAIQYIHANLSTGNDLYVQLYDSNGNTVGAKLTLYDNRLYTYITLTNGQEYYIKITSYFGNYTCQIAFNTSSIHPPIPIQIALNTWVNGELGYYNEQWYKFTATADTKYIHVLNNDYTTSLRVQVCSLNNDVLYYRSLSGDDTYFQPPLTIGQEYIIKVFLYNTGSAKYKIALSTSSTPPPQ